MKKVSTLLLVAVFVLSASFLYAAEPLKIGIVSVDKIFSDSNAGKKATADLEALVKAKQAAVNDKGTKVQELQNALQAETDPAAKAKQQAELTKLSSEYQELLTGSQEETKKKAVELRTAILDASKKILAAIAAEEKLQAIFTSETVPYFSDSLNVTNKVIKRLNEEKKAK